MARCLLPFFVGVFLGRSRQAVHCTIGFLATLFLGAWPGITPLTFSLEYECMDKYRLLLSTNYNCIVSVNEYSWHKTPRNSYLELQHKELTFWRYCTKTQFYLPCSKTNAIWFALLSRCDAFFSPFVAAGRNPLSLQEKSVFFAYTLSLGAIFYVLTAHSGRLKASSTSKTIDEAFWLGPSSLSWCVCLRMVLYVAANGHAICLQKGFLAEGKWDCLPL